MSFKEDVESTVHLQGQWCAGLKALRDQDAARLKIASTRTLRGSVDIDSALQPHQPNANRWDYVVAQTKSNEERLHWIEVHPASGTSSIGEIEAKHQWLRGWLATTALNGYKSNSYYWIASGKTSFNQGHPKIKALASSGVRFCGSHLAL